MEENGLTRLEKEKKVQQRRLLLILAFLGTFFGGFILGMVVGARGPSKPVAEAPSEVAEEGVVSTAPGTNETSKEEVALTFYQRLQEPTQEVPARKQEETLRPKAPSTPTPTLVLQVASFRDPKKARSLSDTFRSQGLRSEVKEVQVKGTTWYRVLVVAGDRREAERLLKDLEAKGFKPMVKEE